MNKKIQFKIRIDPELFERVNMLDEILNRHRRTDGRGNVKVNITKSVYWEGVMKEHMNSEDIVGLLRLKVIKKEEGDGL